MITCPSCGAKNPTGAMFCDGCGAALTVSAASQAQKDGQAQLAAAHAARATAQQATVHARAQFATGRLPPQTMLGKRYLILKRIGQGGMAAVYQASDTRANRVVAIKEMSQDDLTPDEQREAVESFEREARLLQRLHHPNLPVVYESFAESGRHYLVMEFVDGETLEGRLVAAKKALPEALTLGWARQLCDVLGYLHGQKPPVIFRDLKPANIMVTRKGQIKLIDFGIARVFSPRSARDTQALGTPGYAPPEQYGNAQTDARADVYALGATLYQLLTNYDVSKTPFALPPVRSRNSAISVSTATAIERATQLNRDHRFASAADFARALGLDPKSSARTATAAAKGQTHQRPAPGATAQRGAAGGAARVPTHGPTRGPTRGPTHGPAVGGRPGQPSKVGIAVETAAKAITAGAMAATAAALQARMNPNAPAKSPGVAFRDAAVAVARTATGPSVALTVQPREIDFGQLRAGQDGVATLTISGQAGAVARGTITASEPWLTVDKTQFNGASTLVTVTARTSQIRGAGPQRTAIEITSGSRHEFVPVRLEIAPAPGARRPAPPPPPPNPRPGPAHAPAGRPAPAGGAAQALAARLAPHRAAAGHVAQRLPLALGGLRLPLSLFGAIALAFGLPWLIATFALPHLDGLSPVVAAWALLAISALGALVGVALAYIGDKPVPGRMRSAALLAAGGALLAFSLQPHARIATAWVAALPAAGQLGGLALNLPLAVAVAAALGAQPLVSRGILQVARFIEGRYTLVLVLAAVFGGWVGLTATQTALNAIFQQPSFAISLASGCGLLVGVAVGLSLAKPIGYLVRRVAYG
ncbi:MAG: protein kinase [Chloroflexota bacterium]|nr:protein kinase [Chloroflexota bacterium]